MSFVLPFLRIDNKPLNKLETVDRNSLLRLGRTVEVSSLDEMRSILDMPQDFAFSGAEVGLVDNSVVNYAAYAFSIKPQADFTSESNPFSAAFRFAVSTFATKEVIDSGKEEEIKKHLESIVDSYEAAFLHALIFSLGFNGGFGVPHNNYRDILSRLVAFTLDLEAGTENIYISIPTPFLYGSLYEVDVQNTALSATTRPLASTQWWQNERFLDTNIKFVKVSFNTNSVLVARNGIVAYSDFLVKNFTRYVLNDFYVERVSVRSGESNIYRLTYDRYFMHYVPVLRTNASARNIFGSQQVTAAVAVYQFAPVGTISNSHPVSFPPADMALYINRVA